MCFAVDLASGFSLHHSRLSRFGSRAVVVVPLEAVSAIQAFQLFIGHPALATAIRRIQNITAHSSHARFESSYATLILRSLGPPSLAAGLRCARPCDRASCPVTADDIVPPRPVILAVSYRSALKLFDALVVARSIRVAASCRKGAVIVTAQLRASCWKVQTVPTGVVT